MNKEEIVLPDLIEPIYAWRIWQVQKINFGDNGGIDYRLRAMNFDSPGVWDSVQEAQCKRDTKYAHANARCAKVPARFCSCGFYAKKNSELLIREFWYDIFWRAEILRGFYAVAVGRVSLWGKIVEHEDGYRAQFAWPRSIMIPWILPRIPITRGHYRRKFTALCNALQAHYQVPVLSYAMPPYFRKRDSSSECKGEFIGALQEAALKL